MAPDEGSGDVVVGVVGKPLGLRGEVYVRPDPDLDVAFEPGRSFGGSHGGALTVAASRQQGRRLAVRFRGVDDRSSAERLRGIVLTVPRDTVTLAGDAFWTADLLGREVVDDDGQLVGVVQSTLDGPAHDYLVLARPDGGEVLVPAVADLLAVTADRVVVHAIPGLLQDESP